MRVLIADDSTFYRKSLEKLISSWNYEAVPARNGSEAWDNLGRETGPSLAILDYTMPGFNGPEVCRLIRERRKSYVYVLMLTARDEQNALLEGFESGADDYLRKPFHELELRARLRVGERIIHAQRALVDMQEALQFKASHDTLTGLWNNGAIIETLRKEIRRAERHGEGLSVCLADIDWFKRVNDTYGHLTGDEVLKEAAQRMRRAVREYDWIGRYGGEEFLAVLPGCCVADAQDTAERLRVALCATSILIEDRAISVTASVGVREWHPGLDACALVAGADEALYAAKTAGRNRVRVHVESTCCGLGRIVSGEGMLTNPSEQQ